MIKRDDLREWQRRLALQPSVWTVLVGSPEGGELDIGNLYASQEAAEEEVAWCKTWGRRARVVCIGHIHNLELAQQRWRSA